MDNVAPFGPVPGLIASMPSRQFPHSEAWTRWLRDYIAAQPDTRSPYWPAWNRFYSREVLKTFYTERPSKLGTKFSEMTGPEFAMARVAISVKRYVDSMIRVGADIDHAKRSDLEGLALVELFRRGLDCGRHHGEINVFIETGVWQILQRGLFELTSPVHVTSHGMRNRANRAPRAVRIDELHSICSPGPSPEAITMLKQAIEGMTDQAFDVVMERNRV